MARARTTLSPRTAVLLSGSLILGLAGPALAQFTNWTSPAVGMQVAQASSTVQDIQRELNRLGYNAGPVDGSMGPRTRAAIQAYQRDHDLRVDGQPNSSLLSHVRDTARSGRSEPIRSGPEPSSRQIADTQDALRTLGYDVGRPSSRLTDETRAAIRSYESDHGLLASGQPSAELLEHMRRNIQTTPEAPTAVDANTIAGIQGELRLRGYQIPRVTGQMDTQSRQAIRDYQQGQGVAVTGEPSAALLADLRAVRTEPAPAAGLTREQRAAAQRALSARGYEAGPPDGVLGPRSRDAIRTFQADNDITPSGELTSRTMALLGLGRTDAVAEPPAIKTKPYRVRARDDFSDGDHTRNPAWRIASGRFEVRGGGLNSTMVPPSERTEAMGRQILGNLLQQQLGFTLPGQETAAAAYLPTRLGPEFRITALVSGSAEAHSHIDLGPYRGNRLNQGYRLNYRTSQSRPLQLIVVNESGISVIASARLPLDGGAPHRLVWTRDAEGRMTVTHKDAILIDVVDRTENETFDGFSLINAGGDWTLHEVILEDRG
ncbi:peptidoglycan-binding domain-containing protein [Thioalkalicoccus limnaeus]|uniref:Peptidoglycan-binding domain-containing protein n=1 Tax=Thioalkalicoccus limnaeus TaxID=120681 RepID=A0ABV4BEG2_9GAMM